MDRRSFLISLSSFSLIPKLYNPPRELEELLNYEEVVIINCQSTNGIIRHNKIIIPSMNRKINENDIGAIFRQVKKISRNWSGPIYIVDNKTIFAHTGDKTLSKSEYLKMIGRFVKFEYLDELVRVHSIKFKLEKIK